MDPKVKRTLKSIKNDNIYSLYENKIYVQTGTRTKELSMPAAPAEQTDFVCFYDIYYIQNKIFAILITGGSGYDMRIEIDEENLVFKGSPVPTY
ncbi:MAG: hypothetical protein K6E75_06155 [Lachnospiraceae bacterium]|nr:hypothetical protein [Lachnospiraceae bacterium]